MPAVIGVKAQVGARTAEAVRRALPRDLDTVDPAVRRSDRADFQAAVALGLAQRVESDPRALAAAIKGELDGSLGRGVLASAEVSGPGFLNLTVADSALWSAVAVRLAAAGIGAVKFADLSNLRIKDYVFDPARMVSYQGHTSVYLQYAYARVNSMLGKLPEEFRDDSGRGLPVRVDVPLEPVERALIFALDEFGAVIEDVAETLEPHRLCTYLFDLAKAWSDFWEKCPVLRAETDARRTNRAALAHLTGRTLRQGLALLGIDAPARI